MYDYRNLKIFFLYYCGLWNYKYILEWNLTRTLKYYVYGKIKNNKFILQFTKKECHTFCTNNDMMSTIRKSDAEPIFNRINKLYGMFIK